MAWANYEDPNRDEWSERRTMHYGVEFRMLRHNSNELVKVRLIHPSMRVAVELEKPDASAILVRVPRRKSILSVPAVCPCL